MKFSGFYQNNKKYLLPIVMMAAVFFIAQGINVPSFSSPQEPKLSSPQTRKPSTSAVVKTLLQSSQIKFTKTIPLLVLSSNAHQFQSPVAHISVPQHETHFFIATAISVIPARAPPA